MDSTNPATLPFCHRDGEVIVFTCKVPFELKSWKMAKNLTPQSEMLMEVTHSELSSPYPRVLSVTSLRFHRYHIALSHDAVNFAFDQHF